MALITLNTLDHRNIALSDVTVATAVKACEVSRLNEVVFFFGGLYWVKSLIFFWESEKHAVGWYIIDTHCILFDWFLELVNWDENFYPYIWRNTLEDYPGGGFKKRCWGISVCAYVFFQFGICSNHQLWWFKHHITTLSYNALVTTITQRLPSNIFVLYTGKLQTSNGKSAGKITRKDGEFPMDVADGRLRSRPPSLGVQVYPYCLVHHGSMAWHQALHLMQHWVLWWKPCMFKERYNLWKGWFKTLGIERFFFLKKKNEAQFGMQKDDCSMYLM